MSEPETTDDTTWDCHRCGHENHDENGLCEECGAPTNALSRLDN